MALRRAHLAGHRHHRHVPGHASSASSIGLVAGFSRGWLDRVISFVIDVFLSLPFLLMALALAPIIILRFDDQPELLELGPGHLADLRS